MQKRRKGRKFNREHGQRKAFIKSLVLALLLREKIKLTEARAKGISGFTEKLISQAKRQNLSARRLIANRFSPKLAKRLIDEIAPRYKNRNGGYTRIIKLGPRKTDGARMAIIELVK